MGDDERQAQSAPQKAGTPLSEPMPEPEAELAPDPVPIPYPNADADYAEEM